ncbi:MAG: sigma-70 family RNA polymerase sigma factor [Bacteroidetes bacterium]|nr:sigma-70 family RNA polymerase sigma factor [Bacteroidota bacterium]
MSQTTSHINTSEWVDQYADALYAFAIARVDDADLAKDFVQETFLAGIKAAENFEGKSSVKTWLISILKRKIIDYYRQKEARKTTPLSHFFSEKGKVGHWLPEAAPKGNYSEMEEALDNQELQQAITNCIELLPGKWKGIVLDKLVEEKESDDVCKEHEITPSNLWVIVHRAKLQLRECLERKWFKA